MNSIRLLLWLIRRPMVGVVVLLVLVAALSAGGAYLLSARRTPPASASLGADMVAPAVLPTPTQHPPRARVEAAHQALHALGRACKAPSANFTRERVRHPLDAIERFADDYPGGGFSMDDEPGSTLTLLIVVWDSLKECDPSFAPEIERLIPEQYRGG